MGKVLLEKLLYSCSELKQIYVLIRPKKGKPALQRIEEMAKSPVISDPSKLEQNFQRPPFLVDVS